MANVERRGFCVLLLLLVGFSVGATAEELAGGAHRVRASSVCTGAGQRDVATWCAQLDQIKTIPSPLEPIRDPLYRQFRLLGYEALPCLIGRILDERVVEAPKGWRDAKPATAGDVALLLIEDLIGSGPLAEVLQDAHVLGEPLRDSGHRVLVKRALEKWHDKEGLKDHTTSTLAASTVALECCAAVHAIRSLPYDGTPSVPPSVTPGDEVYAALLELGETAVPCLIDKVLDMRLIADPRSAPKAWTTVGDVALMVLERISGAADIETVAYPREILSKAQTEGYWALLEYSAGEVNRRRMHEALKAWYERRYASAGAH